MSRPATPLGRTPFCLNLNADSYPRAHPANTHPAPHVVLKILVTGASGFLGATLTHRLLDTGANVRILRRETSRLDLLGDAADRVEHVVGDVSLPETLGPALEGIDQVFHTAAYIGFSGRRDLRQLQRVNVEGTAHIVNAALHAGVKRLVHTSSMAAFGRPESSDTVIDETAIWQASRLNTPYAVSKYLSELEVYRGIAEGLDAVIVNPALIFGAGRPGENTLQIVEKVRQEKLPAVPSGGTNVVDVRDVATGHLLAMSLGLTGERYFLGGENLSWRAIIETLATAFGAQPPRFTLSPRAASLLATLSEAAAFVTRTRPLLTRDTARASARFHRYSNSKAREAFGLRFRPFKETAADLAETLAG